MKYVNRAKHIVSIVLKTGETVHLAENETSRPLEPFEIDRNADIERLVNRGVIAAVSDVTSRQQKKS